jgi:hypothetical protein
LKTPGCFLEDRESLAGQWATVLATPGLSIH